MSALIIRGMWGLGDNIYSRPFIRAAARRSEVFLETPWPQLYADLPIKFIRAERRLRTQMQNLLRQPDTIWATAPKGAQEIRLTYNGRDLAARGILGMLESLLPLNCGEKLRMDLPPLGPAPFKWGRRRMGFVRPVTVRSEWRNEARNPEPVYLRQVANTLRAGGFKLIGVASLKEGEEWPVGEMPAFDRDFTHGELGLLEMLALARDSDILLGGVGFLVPLALALGKSAFVILGGHGVHNAPALITDSRLDCSQLGFAKPERFCLCSNMLHRCDKKIMSLPAQWNQFASRRALPSWTSSAGRA